MKVFTLAYLKVRDGEMVYMRIFVDRQQSRALLNVIGRKMLDQMRGATYGDSRCNLVHLALWAHASEGQSPGRIAHAPGAKIFFADAIQGTPKCQWAEKC